MTKLESLLDEIEKDEVYWAKVDESQHRLHTDDLKDALTKIRGVLKNCTILEWHPASEIPADGGYLLRNLSIHGHPTVTGIRRVFRGKWDLFSEETFTEWAYLPEQENE